MGQVNDGRTHVEVSPEHREGYKGEVLSSSIIFAGHLPARISHLADMHSYALQDK